MVNKLEENTATGCWEWQRYKDGKGYGRIYIKGKPYRAHRIVWANRHGPIPPGMVIMHTCDNPACVNLEHLKLGTQKDNVQDVLAKGRRVHKGGRSATPLKRLEPARELRAQGLTYEAIASRIGVSVGAVWKYLNTKEPT